MYSNRQTETERPLTEVLQNAIGNVQEIFRSEVRLAKAEVKEEMRRAVRGVSILGAGLVLGIYSINFLLFTCVFGLGLNLSLWSSALIVAVGTGLCAAILVKSGIAQVRKLDPTPEKTVQTMRENLEWARHRGH